MAGPYPGTTRTGEAIPKIESLIDAGVREFIDLTEEDELIPYVEDARRLGAQRGIEIKHRRFPIKDVSIPDRPEQMREILDAIAAVVAAGRIPYIHCWGGVGRTGTVVGCMLVEDGCGIDEVIERIKKLRCETERAHRPSPETDWQREFIFGWAEQVELRSSARWPLSSTRSTSSGSATALTGPSPTRSTTSSRA